LWKIHWFNRLPDTFLVTNLATDEEAGIIFVDAAAANHLQPALGAPLHVATEVVDLAVHYPAVGTPAARLAEVVAGPLVELLVNLDNVVEAGRGFLVGHFQLALFTFQFNYLLLWCPHCRGKRGKMEIPKPPTVEACLFYITLHQSDASSI